MTKRSDNPRLSLDEIIEKFGQKHQIVVHYAALNAAQKSGDREQLKEARAQLERTLVDTLADKNSPIDPKMREGLEGALHAMQLDW